VQQSATFSSVGLLDVPSSTPPRPSGRKRHISRHLSGLVTKAGEICRLDFALLMSVINPPSVVAGENNIGKEEREMEAISY